MNERKKLIKAADALKKAIKNFEKLGYSVCFWDEDCDEDWTEIGFVEMRKNIKIEINEQYKFIQVRTKN